MEEKSHWIFGIFNYNPKDKRILCPKRNAALGWTFNFGNPYSVALFLVLAAIVVIWEIYN